jgi:hypothetical protein
MAADAAWASVHELVIHGVARQFSNAGHLHLFQQASLVRTDCLVADIQLVSNIIDSQTFDQTFENVKLARRK